LLPARGKIRSNPGASLIANRLYNIYQDILTLYMWQEFNERKYKFTLGEATCHLKSMPGKKS